MTPLEVISIHRASDWSLIDRLFLTSQLTIQSLLSIIYMSPVKVYPLQHEIISTNPLTIHRLVHLLVLDQIKVRAHSTLLLESENVPESWKQALISGQFGLAQLLQATGESVHFELLESGVEEKEKRGSFRWWRRYSVRVPGWITCQVQEWFI